MERLSTLKAQHKARETKKVIKGKNTEGKRVLNQYVLERKLGEGATAKVRLGIRHPQYEKYAIKILNKIALKKKRELIRGPDGKMKLKDALEDIMREISIMKTLDHPNVMKLYETITSSDHDKLYLVMDCADYGQLIDWDEDRAEFFNSHGPGFIPEKYLKKIFKETTLGLRYLHGHGIIHRDLKPQNILMDMHGNMKIVDFGVALQLENGSQDTMQDTQGTYHFIPPEACAKNGNGYSGKKADIWALGITLYSFVFFKVPFYSDNLVDLFNAIDTEAVKFPTAPVISDQLKDLLLAILEKDPAKRITIDEILKHKWLQDAPIDIDGLVNASVTTPGLKKKKTRGMTKNDIDNKTSPLRASPTPFKGSPLRDSLTPFKGNLMISDTNIKSNLMLSDANIMTGDERSMRDGDKQDY